MKSCTVQVRTEMRIFFRLPTFHFDYITEPNLKFYISICKKLKKHKKICGVKVKFTSWDGAKSDYRTK